MEAAREIQVLRARAEKAEKLAAQLGQQLADERARTAAQKSQMEQLERQIEALLKRLYGDVLPDDSAASKRASIAVPSEHTQAAPAIPLPRSRSKTDTGVVREVAKKTTMFLRRLSDALPGSGSSNGGASGTTPRGTPRSSAPGTTSASTTPRATTQAANLPPTPLSRSRSGPSSSSYIAENTALRHEQTDFVKPLAREKAKERVAIAAGTESPRKRAHSSYIVGAGTVRGVPGEAGVNSLSLRRLRSMHTSTPLGPSDKALGIRRTRSEEQLSSWDCIETTLIGRKTSARTLLPQPERPRAPSCHVTVLEQEYVTSANPSPKRDQSDLTWSPSGSIRAASIMRYVDYIVFANSDLDAVRTLIISYRLYEKPVWLLANLSFSFTRATSEAVRRRVLFILRRWLECAPCDFADATMRSTLVRFLERDVRKRSGMEEHAVGLLRVLNDHEGGSTDCSASRSSSNSNNSSCNSSCSSEVADSYMYMDTPIAKLELICVDPGALAEQLTLMDFAFFRRVSVTHWLANCKSGSWQSTPVATLVQRFNNVSAFLAFEIVTTFHLKKRAAVIKHLILTARRLLELNNFHGLMAVLSALSNAAVARLKRTWKALPSNIRSLYTQLEDVTEPKANFQAYRQAIKRIAPPAIPYLAVCMRDLTVIHEANQSIVSKTLMNVEKCEMLAKIIGEFEVCKTASYTMLQSVSPLQKFIESFANSLDTSVINENSTHAFSLRCEQRALEL